MTSTVLTDVLKAKTTNGSLTISGNGTGNVDMKNLATTDAPANPTWPEAPE